MCVCAWVFFRRKWLVNNWIGNLALRVILQRITSSNGVQIWLQITTSTNPQITARLEVIQLNI